MSLHIQCFSLTFFFTHPSTPPTPVEANDRVLHSERIKYDSMRSELDTRVRDLAMTVGQKDMDRLKMTAELENRYEHKLAEQIDR